MQMQPSGDRRRAQPDSGGERRPPTRFRRPGCTTTTTGTRRGIRRVDVQLRRRRTGCRKWARAPAELLLRIRFDNLRVYYRNASGAETIYFYGADGTKLATYTYTIITYNGDPEIQLTQQSENVYFLGKLISAEGDPVPRTGWARCGRGPIRLGPPGAVSVWRGIQRMQRRMTGRSTPPTRATA